MAGNEATPQELVGTFWEGYITKKPGAVTAIFPKSLYATLVPPPHAADKAGPTKNAGAKYEAAAAECREKVARIVRDCRRTNVKFTDPDFDLRGNNKDCLLALNWKQPPSKADPRDVADAIGALQQNLVVPDDSSLAVHPTVLRQILNGKVVTGTDDDDDDPNADDNSFNPNPGSIHRVNWIFAQPQFTVDGYSSSDIMQGANSEDCWWLSSVATICHRRDLMDRICVARDEACGVYGFVFHRDGDWVSVVVDDFLCLTAPDFDTTGDGLYDPTDSVGAKYRKANQTGSEALYFAGCRDPNETWLPLLEKAYAKLHGDYSVCWGGWIGEAVEDLTGGVHTEMYLEDVLGKDTLWTELVNREQQFVFGLDILEPTIPSKNGLATGHAYSLLEAREESGEDGKSVRLVKVRNPWGARGGDGMGEWNGPWSDGSKEWTPYWLTKLKYQFGNDGVFWMTFDDMLNTFTSLYRTRLFDEKWTITQQWTSVNVAWLTGYQQRKFVVEIRKNGTYVLVLQQLDDRYFVGLEGQYAFELHFILQKQGGAASDYICRVRPFNNSIRAVSCEIELEPGTYEVLPKITGYRDTKKPTIQDVIAQYADKRPQKLREVGLSFDLAHAKVLGKDETPANVEAAASELNKDQKPEPAPPATVAAAASTAPPSAVEAVSAVVEAGGPSSQEAPGAAYGTYSDQQAQQQSAPASGGADASDAAQPSKPPSPWNAVCVIGLKVYSYECDVSISLAEPNNPEEASSLIMGE